MAKKIQGKHKFFSAISYIGPLFILTFIFQRKNKFCSFHTKQGLALFIISIIASAIMSGFSVMLLSAAAKLLGTTGIVLVDLIIIGISIFLLVLAIEGLVASIKGKQKRIYLIGNIAENFNF